MQQQLLIYTDAIKKIRYNDEFLGLEKTCLDNCCNIKSLNLENFGLAILDVENGEEALHIANRLRSKVPFLPILFVRDTFHPKDICFFVDIAGCGIVRIINPTGSGKKTLRNVVRQMLSPHPLDASHIAVILPVYNEAKRFDNVIRCYHCIREIAKKTGHLVSIYFMNDGSSDETPTLIQGLIEKEQQKESAPNEEPFVFIKHLQHNTRKAGTYIEAFRQIDADIFVFCDADNSFFKEDIVKMINILNHGYYEFVAGTKDHTASNRELQRKLLSFIKRALTRSMLPKGVTDSQTGLKACKRIVSEILAPSLQLTSGLAIDLEILYRSKQHGIRVLQLPVKCVDVAGSHVNLLSDSLHFLKVLSQLMVQKVDIKIG